MSLRLPTSWPTCARRYSDPKELPVSGWRVEQRSLYWVIHSRFSLFLEIALVGMWVTPSSKRRRQVQKLPFAAFSSFVWICMMRTTVLWTQASFQPLTTITGYSIGGEEFSQQLLLLVIVYFQKRVTSRLCLFGHYCHLEGLGSP